MLSFGVKNVVRIDIFTHDTYILITVRILLIIFEKNPQFSCLCTNIIAKETAVSRTKEHKAFEMPNCMKQHLNVFLRGRKVMCKEYLCNCGSCLNYWFQEHGPKLAMGQPNNSYKKKVKKIIELRLLQWNISSWNDKR